MHKKEYNTVVVGVAFSPNLQANVFEALRMSVLFSASLVMVHVGEKSAEKEKTLANIIAGFSEALPSYTVLWKAGHPVEVLLSACVSQSADLLILGAIQREGLLKYYIGSVARKLTRKCPCDVLLLIKPSVERMPCSYAVVNGLADEKTEETSLRKSTIVKERIRLREKSRVEQILTHVPKQMTAAVQHDIQPIFGRRGYSIGHFARVKRADLLVMNAPQANTLWDRIFPHDIEYILSDLPTDVLIVR